MEINGDPIGIAVGSTLVLAGVCRSGGKGMASGGQATGWRDGNCLQDLQTAREAQAFTGN